MSNPLLARRSMFDCLRHPNDTCGGQYTRCRLIVKPDQLQPMRAKGESTLRAIERWEKGHAR